MLIEKISSNILCILSFFVIIVVYFIKIENIYFSQNIYICYPPQAKNSGSASDKRYLIPYNTRQNIHLSVLIIPCVTTLGHKFKKYFRI
jgi:hypothetical protein